MVRREAVAEGFGGECWWCRRRRRHRRQRGQLRWAMAMAVVAVVVAVVVGGGAWEHRTRQNSRFAEVVRAKARAESDAEPFEATGPHVAPNVGHIHNVLIRHGRRRRERPRHDGRGVGVTLVCWVYGSCSFGALSSLQL